MHLWDHSYLGKSPLGELKSVQEQMPHRAKLSRVDRGRAISAVLRAAIDHLKPIEDLPDFSISKHHHAILHKAYIEGLKNDVIAKSIGISERTFYREHANAVQALAETLCDWES